MNNNATSPKQQEFIETAKGISIGGQSIPELVERVDSLIGVAIHLAKDNDPSGGYYTVEVLKELSRKTGNLMAFLTGEDPDDYGFRVEYKDEELSLQKCG